MHDVDKFRNLIWIKISHLLKYSDSNYYNNSCQLASHERYLKFHWIVTWGII